MVALMNLMFSPKNKPNALLMIYRKIIRNFRGCLLCTAAILAIISCNKGQDKDLIKHFSEQQFEQASAFAQKGYYAAAVGYIDSTYSRFPFISVADKYRYYRFKVDIFSAENGSSFAQLKQANYAFACLDSNIQMIEEKGKTHVMSKEYASLLALKATFLLYVGDYKRAGDLLSKTRLLCTETGNFCVQADIAATVGSVYYGKARYHDALQYYQEAATQRANCSASKLDEFYFMQGLLDNTGLCYAKIGRQDSAIMYYQKALAYVEANKYLYVHNNNPNFPEIVKSLVFVNLAQAFSNIGDYKNAEEYLKKSISIVDSNNRQGFARASNLEALIKLARVYLKSSRANSAWLLLSEAANANAAEMGDDMKMLWQQTMYWYYQSKANVKKENYHLQNFLALRDSVALKKKPLYQINLLGIFSNDEKEYQLKILQKNSTIRLVYIETLSGVVFLILLLSSVFYYHWKRAKKAERKFTVLNQKLEHRQVQLQKLLGDIETENNQKERILRVVAHDLRNPLSNIKMLSSMQAGGTGFEEEEFLRLVKLSCTDSLRLTDEIIEMESGEQAPVA